MKPIILLPLLLLIAAADAGDQQRYNQCLATIKTAPDTALTMATGWRAEGGGVPAIHCQALALLEQGNASRAAGLLDSAAEALGPQNKSNGFAGAMWAQSGNAWLLAGDSDRAIARLTTALGLLPATGDARANVLIDRARAYADKKTWDKSISDLNSAATLSPSNADIFLLRATAKRRSGDLAGARTDIQVAGALAPGNIDILVERGISNAQSQQLDAALGDWRKVMALAPGSDQAKIAKGYVSQLEPLAAVKIKPKPVFNP
jgi:tetratricopeptide (TPR) repeat protein